MSTDAFSTTPVTIVISGNSQVAFYSHLEAGTFRKPNLEEWLRGHVTTG